MASNTAYRNLHQWGMNQRTPTAATAQLLSLLCRLWAVQLVVFARTRPGGDTLPEKHVVVSGPDGWWLLEKGASWEERIEYKGSVGGLVSEAGKPLEGYDVPMLQSTFPDEIGRLLGDLADATGPTIRERFAGVEAGLRPLMHLLPPGLWEGIQSIGKQDAQVAMRHLQDQLEQFRRS